MDWIEFIDKFQVTHLVQLVIVGIIVVYWSHKLMVRLEDRMEKQIQRMDAQILSHAEQVSKQIADQSARSDRLYEMFIDLLKENKKVVRAKNK